MQVRKKLGIVAYLLVDYLAAILAWTGLFLYRKSYIEDFSLAESYSHLIDTNYFYGILFIPLGWLLLYAITGTYTDIYRKSRLRCRCTHCILYCFTR